MAAWRRTLGDEHPHTLTSINNLGGLREAKGDLAGAEALFEEAVEAVSPEAAGVSDALSPTRRAPAPASAQRVSAQACQE